MKKDPAITFSEWLAALRNASATAASDEPNVTSVEVAEALGQGRVAATSFLRKLCPTILRPEMVTRTTLWGITRPVCGFQIIDPAAFRNAVEARKKG